MFKICNGNFCYSDDETVNESAESRANLARLTSADGVYSRQSMASDDNDEFVIDIVFNNAITFNSLKLKKVLHDTDDYADQYKNTCLSLTTRDPVTEEVTVSSSICTDADFGFTDSGISTESFDDAEDIVFAGTLASTTNVVSARLVFDTSSATGSNAMNDADDGPNVQIKQMIIA